MVGFPGTGEELPYEALDFSYTVGVVPGLAIVLGCALLLIRLYMRSEEKTQHDRLMLVLLAIGCVLLLASTEAFPWKWLCHLPRHYSVLFQQIQYPRRMLSIATPLLCIPRNYMRELFGIVYQCVC